MLLEELRRHRILNPTRRMLELLVHKAQAGLNACSTAH
jgi:hypothetical protein